ncbi:MAG: phosphoglycerate kinase, partial [Candidatus Cloacimonetes bacterium]|nr:phosphoglycerate kinase [Candidatus Cloacimonadota bacterium]
DFARELAKPAELFVNDAFGTAHRKHASNVGVASILPSAMGFLIENELKYLRDSLTHPQKPFTAIFGGAKVSGKIELLERILEKADNLLIAGAMMFTFIRARGYETGKSLVEEDKIDMAKNVMKLAEEKNVQLVIPEDTIIAKEPEKYAETKTVSIEDIPQDWMGLDIGEKTIQKYKDIIADSKTIVWNGPMGMFEIDKFAKGTNEIAKILAESDATTIIGGGDSAAAIEKIGLQDKFTHISTGGGASLEMLAGNELPGISIIPDA